MNVLETPQITQYFTVDFYVFGQNVTFIPVSHSILVNVIVYRSHEMLGFHLYIEQSLILILIQYWVGYILALCSCFWGSIYDTAKRGHSILWQDVLPTKYAITVKFSSGELENWLRHGMMSARGQWSVWNDLLWQFDPYITLWLQHISFCLALCLPTPYPLCYHQL